MTGTISGWGLVGNHIWGKMEVHTSRPDLVGKECRTSAVKTILMVDGKRIAHTNSGSVYLLID